MVAYGPKVRDIIGAWLCGQCYRKVGPAQPGAGLVPRDAEPKAFLHNAFMRPLIPRLTPRGTPGSE